METNKETNLTTPEESDNPVAQKRLYLATANDDAEMAAEKERRNAALKAIRLLQKKAKTKEERKLEIKQEADKLERYLAELKGAEVMP